MNSSQFYVEKVGSGAFLTISSGGNVGVGTNNPQASLQVKSKGTMLVGSQDHIGETCWDNNDDPTERNYTRYKNGEIDCNRVSMAPAMYVDDTAKKVNINYDMSDEDFYRSRKVPKPYYSSNIEYRHPESVGGSNQLKVNATTWLM